MTQPQNRKPVIYQMMTRLFGNTQTRNKPFGTLQENGVGKFKDITRTALDSLRNLGITHVWYTGVIEHATQTDYSAAGITTDHPDVVKGMAGSPYAIKDYYDINPDLATDVTKRMSEFEALVQRTHEAGMQVIIDFVPNHVARQYHSDAKPAGVTDLGEKDNTAVRFQPSNNFYYLPGESLVVPRLPQQQLSKNPYKETPAKVTGNDVLSATPNIGDWYETIKLNYGINLWDRSQHFDPVPDTWVKMKDILAFWTHKGVDGFRCDMAEMVPVQFWAWAIPQIQEINPDIIFIAEIYNPAAYRDYLKHGKFHLLYDKVQLYDTLRLLLKGERRAADVAWIYEDLADLNGSMLHFLENHDEQRIASPEFAGDPWKALPAMVVSATLDKGPVMIYFGQEVGEPGAGAEGFQGNDGRTTIFDYWGVPEHVKWVNEGKFDGGKLSPAQKDLRRFYQRLLTFASTQPAIVSGAYYDLTRMNADSARVGPQVSAYIRYTETDGYLIVSNFSGTPQNFRLLVPSHAQTTTGIRTDLPFKDFLDGTSTFRLENGSEVPMEVKPYSSLILKVK